MKLTPGLPLVVCACLLLSQCFAQQPGVVILNTSSKELKRAAHRLRIPVEQLKNARQTLQEATDLAKKIDPCPVDQFFGIVQGWNQVDRSKAKSVLDSLVQDLRTEAASCTDTSCYQRATSTAMSLMQSSDLDYEKIMQLIRNWPDPKETMGDAARSFKEAMENQVKRQSLLRLAGTDPEKALSLLPQTGDSGGYNYTASGQVAQGLMSAGKKEEALRLIDQTIRSFNPNATDARSLQDYENFVRNMAMSVDSARASEAAGGLIAAIMNQPSVGPCGAATVKSGDTSVELTCAESRILNLVRGFPMKPGFTLKTLESAPGLKSKLDSLGGIDALYPGGTSGTGISVSYNSSNIPPGAAYFGSAIGVVASPPVNTAKLIQELKGKDSAYAKSKLKDLSIDVLINLAMSVAYQDPDVGAAALEIAQQLLLQVEPLQKRASSLQSLVQAYRQVEGEVDASLLKTGFVLADELKQDVSEKADALGRRNPVAQVMTTQAGQLEAFLVAELSRTSYESAIRYVHSMENNALKLMCLLQIVQALSQPNF